MGVSGSWALRVGLVLGALALLLQGLRGWLACKRYEFQPAEIAQLARHHAGRFWGGRQGVGRGWWWWYRWGRVAGVPLAAL